MGNEVAAKAKETIDYLNAAPKLTEESETNQSVNYSKEVDGKHSYVVVVPSKKTDINKMKALISDFNGKYFGKSNLTVSNVELDEKQQMISIKSFDDKVAAMYYHTKFIKNTDLLSLINKSPDNSFFPLTYENYAKFYQNKNVKEYLEFFQIHYTD